MTKRRFTFLVERSNVAHLHKEPVLDNVVL